MTNLVTNTKFSLLKDFWDAKENFSIPENRVQFENAFISALSSLSDPTIWKAALETARDTVLKNMREKKKE